ncbi:hypothetical protein K435DRAFT_853499 [Dendrothele bispora CBS 962.96]|uniref:Uncharacterized protein n=1 Tax=Dendrothele bispora (strain CBS 962.96) TaxID=1314807 RepID=A0A4S8MH91_DENBC|nr:hypothetical protein K435DRAFT_853499 [Dendrothele bispora CBS 962.96]
MEDIDEDDIVLSMSTHSAEVGATVLGAYKKVGKRVRPIPAPYPEWARTTRRFPEDPLASLPKLTPYPPEFSPTERITEERMKKLNLNPDGFLWPEEEKIVSTHHGAES